MSAQWETPVVSMEIHHAEHPTITAVALTSPQELHKEQHVTGNPATYHEEKCRQGKNLVFSLRRDGQRIATTVLIQDHYGWRYGLTEGLKGETPHRAATQAALTLARACRSPHDEREQPRGLNPMLPDPDEYDYADQRAKRAAALARQATSIPYDPANPTARADIWRECLQQARDAATQPHERASLQEVAFAHQLAVNAAIMCQQYEEAGQMLPHALAAAKNAAISPTP